MSGNTRPQELRYYEEPRRWGPAGWYCCNRLTVTGDIPGMGTVVSCRACGHVARVNGTQVVQTVQVGRRVRRRTRIG